MRRDARYCDSCCAHAASRALREFEKTLGKGKASGARAHVEKLEGKGWLRRDAIHAVGAALGEEAERGIALEDATLKAPRCSCGEPVALRANARTCGRRSACRMKLLRRRNRILRRRGRLREVVRCLFVEYRRKRFSGDEARSLGADHRLGPRYVNKLLRELVEDGGVLVVQGMLDTYRFAPPHRPPAP